MSSEWRPFKVPAAWSAEPADHRRMARVRTALHAIAAEPDAAPKGALTYWSAQVARMLDGRVEVRETEGPQNLRVVLGPARRPSTAWSSSSKRVA